MKTTTRFAPSPTGYIHIGNVRSAIYPYLIAKQADGTFILRIEDTDQKRYVEGATELIEDTLKWLGLDWDEGPEKGGEHAPYFQTERKDIYIKYAMKLIEQGRAYADPTDAETLQKYREDATSKKQAFLYRNYRPVEIPEWEPGVPLRFKSDPKLRTYHDKIYGDQELKPETQDDIILIKADGFPTYNFAHIIDDFEMGVTHVTRGQEYLPSMGNYLALYEALDITPPKFVHLPHILGPSGTKKLSKRDGAKSVTDYKNEGILPEAMLNFLACLGWNDGTEQELYTKEELIEKFSIDRIQNSPARFDEQKLIWLNGQWIRQKYQENPDELYHQTHNFWPETATNEDKKRAVFDIIYDRLKTLSDLKTMTNYFFAEPEIDLPMLTENKFIKKLDPAELPQLIRQAIQKLESVTDWNVDNLTTATNKLLQESGKKPAELFSLIRIAVSFAPFSPALPDTLHVLGKDAVMARLDRVAKELVATT